MSIFHDKNSERDSLIRDISDKHCPDSIRESAYRELQRRGYSKQEAQRMADEKYGDFWG